MSRTTPSRRGERILGWCLRNSGVAHSIIGDLRQEYAEFVSVRGRLVADAWYWTQVVEIGLRYLGRGTRSPDTPPSLASARGGFLEGTLRDITLALRGVRRAPGFSAAVVLTFALGIGANATMFGVVDRVLLSPPEGVRDHETLRVVHLTGLGQRSVNSPLSYSFPDYLALRADPVLADAAMFASPSGGTITTGVAAASVEIQPA